MLGVSEEQSGGPCGWKKQGTEHEAEEEVGKAATTGKAWKAKVSTLSRTRSHGGAERRKART